GGDGVTARPTGLDLALHDMEFGISVVFHPHPEAGADIDGVEAGGIYGEAGCGRRYFRRELARFEKHAVARFDADLGRTFHKSGGTGVEGDQERAGLHCEEACREPSVV